mgnify:CR=1 FL=1
MKSLLLACALLLQMTAALARETPPDTVTTGIYVTSIHDIDFKQSEYTVNLWLWLNYKNKDFDFVQNLEIPQAKSFTRSYSTMDTSNGRVYLLMKLQCLMKDSWRINNFPFDRQKLRFSIENSQFDSRSLVFAIDTLGKHYDHRFTLRGWNIDSFKMSTGVKVYETTFGDSSIAVPHTEYSSFMVRIGIDRDATQLFWKMFLGMYVSFLIAYTCFYIHADNIDSRFGLGVGSLFAAIGNKYIIDSSLPDSTTFTLVDTLHGITLFFIFAVIIASAWSLKLIKADKAERARKMDLVLAQVVLVLYVLLNIYFITKAQAGAW